MTTAGIVSELVPLSRYRGEWQGFLSTCSYADRDFANDRQRRRYEGDLRLLQRLSEAIGPDGCFGDVNEATAIEIVEDVEEGLFEIRWRLTGAEGEPILARLDAHFAGPQARWVQQREEREAREVVLARERDEQAVNQLRIDITFGRQSVKETQARIKQLERELAAEAERLGVPAWP